MDIFKLGSMPVNPDVQGAVTAAQTAFSDNFGVVAVLFVGISVTVTLVVMAVNWFRKAAK
ncbi:MAG: hypothetical protein ING71_15745 [Rhodocyclaceae bacterium]|nr:hypothetical protein [Rhodocyclaceae bacterium]